MLTLDEIKAISFRKANFNGYKTEDVDKFIDDIVETVAKLTSEKAKLLKQLDLLVKKVDEYRASEDAVGIAMLNAQKIAEASVKEATEKANALTTKAEKNAETLENSSREKSETMLRLAKEKYEDMIKEANDKSNNMIREATLTAKNIVMEANEKAENIVYEANAAIIGNRELLISLEKEVSAFRSTIMREYKNHIRLIDSLPNKEQVKQNINVINNKYVVPDYITPIDVTPYTIYDNVTTTTTTSQNENISDNDENVQVVTENFINNDTIESSSEVIISNEEKADYGELNFNKE